MSSISIVMIANNASNFISEAIESVLIQSFPDFEFIIVNDSSTDNTLSVLSSYNDNRIHLIENEHDNFNLLITGLKAATGKYLVLMDADSICHIDRLKIQYAIMEEFPEITVCSSWVSIYGEKTPVKFLRKDFCGLVENPLFQLLLDNYVYTSSTMTRISFIKQHNLLYEKFTYEEDYQFWTEASKSGAVFYIESQPLVYKRVDDSPNKTVNQEKQFQTASGIKRGIIDFLCRKNEKHPALQSVNNAFYELLNDRLITEDEMVKTLYTLFMKNKDKLNLL